jgi:hypothetical protein
MNAYKKIILTCIGFAVFSVGVAQEKKIYRWVDKDGKVHISDQLPPEANDQARKEYSASTGTLKKDVSKQPTAAEQAIADKIALEEAYALEQAETAKRIEQGMVNNFETEQDLQRSFDERTDLLKQTIVSLKVSIQSRRAIVISGLNELSDLELNGRALPLNKVNDLQKNHDVVEKQVTQLGRLNTRFNLLQNEFALILERYRELKGTALNTPADPNALPKETTQQ